jgi:methylenetetrahydrofolate reductase (NADPH)
LHVVQATMPRIIDKIKELTADTKLFFSVEFFPPKTEPGVINLYDRMERMALLRPAFVTVTWGTNCSTKDLSLDIGTAAQNLMGLETLLHLTCTNTPTETLLEILNSARANGIQNIFALRGDPDKSSKKNTGELKYAIDLIKLIRQHHGDYFGIAVAGYPEGHEESSSYEEDLENLRKKVEAGASLVITQLFYDINVFLKFVQDCRAIGIKCPIIPGLMPIHSYSAFVRCLPLMKTVPHDVLDALEPIKYNDEAVKDYGVRLLVDMVRKLSKHGVRGFHFFSLNLERSITRIVDELDLLDEQVQRELPWRKSANPRRYAAEEVRPIFWANRPKSYLAKTMAWDDFPNGRWGDSRSPAFGECDHHHTRLLLGSRVGKTVWANVNSVAEVISIFRKYIRGEIKSLPWFESSLAAESKLITEKLDKINSLGFLTINSQPSVHGVPSTEQSVGWGPVGGYVYQKEYVEFFCSPWDLSILLEVLNKDEFKFVSYMAVNSKGDDSRMNVTSVNAVTWGVFPGKEILQPTVVDPISFGVWKDEAFALWLAAFTDRAVVTLQDDPPPAVFQEIHDTWYLVNLVENDFVKGDLWTVFERVQQHPDFRPPKLEDEPDQKGKFDKKKLINRYFSDEKVPILDDPDDDLDDDPDDGD